MVKQPCKQTTVGFFCLFGDFGFLKMKISVWKSNNLVCSFPVVRLSNWIEQCF